MRFAYCVWSLYYNVSAIMLTLAKAKNMRYKLVLLLLLLINTTLVSNAQDYDSAYTLPPTIKNSAIRNIELADSFSKIRGSVSASPKASPGPEGTDTFVEYDSDSTTYLLLEPTSKKKFNVFRFTLDNYYWITLQILTIFFIWLRRHMRK